MPPITRSQKSKRGKKHRVSSSSPSHLKAVFANRAPQSSQKSKRGKKRHVSSSSPSHLEAGFANHAPQFSQKSKRGEKRHVPSSSPSHLETFFANYAPQFQYNATASASLEFYRLCKQSGWGRDDLERKTAHNNFKDALVNQFNVDYGMDANELRNWQKLCHVVRIDPVPEGLHACREAVYYSFVNLVDLVDTPNTGVEVRVFESERDLSEYTISTGKFFPRENAYAGGLLQYLLRHILHPRDSYSRLEGNRRR